MFDKLFHKEKFRIILLILVLISPSFRTSEISYATGISDSVLINDPYWTLPTDEYIVEVLTLDLDGDGWTEFGVLTKNNEFTVVNLSGNIRWSIELPPDVETLISANLDADLNDEILFGINQSSDPSGQWDEGSKVIAVSEFGEILWTHEFGKWLCEIDEHQLTGRQRVGISITLCNLIPAEVVMLNSDGSTLWSFLPRDTYGNVVKSFSTLNSDPIIFIGTDNSFREDYTSSIYALDQFGNKIWEASPNFTGEITDIKLGDFNKDGIVDILTIINNINGNQSWLCRYSSEGFEEWCIEVDLPFLRTDVLIHTYETDSGTVIVTGENEGIKAYNENGIVIWEKYLGSTEFISTQTIDSNNDGNDEVIALVNERNSGNQKDFDILLDINLDGDIIQKWEFPSDFWSYFENYIPVEFIAISNGTEHFIFSDNRTTRFYSSKNISLETVGDFNNNGYLEGLDIKAQELSLIGLPLDRYETVYNHTWHSDIQSALAIQMTSIKKELWIGSASGPLYTPDNQEYEFSSQISLISVDSGIAWSTNILGKANSIWLGAPNIEGIPSVLAVSTSEDFYPDTPIASHEGTVGWVYAIDSEGNVMWETQLDDPPLAIDCMVDDSGQIKLIVVAIGGSIKNAQPGIIAFDSDGNFLWKVNSDEAVADIQVDNQGIYAVTSTWSQSGFSPVEPSIFAISQSGDKYSQVQSDKYFATIGKSAINTSYESDVIFDVDEISYFKKNALMEYIGELTLDGDIVDIAFGDMTGDGRSEVLIGTVDSGGTGQLYLIDENKKILMAIALPDLPKSVAIIEGIGNISPFIVVGFQPRMNVIDNLIAIDNKGKQIWSYPVKGDVLGITSRFDSNNGLEVVYVTTEEAGTISEVYLPPTLIADPQYDLYSGLFSAYIKPDQSSVEVTLEIWEPSRQSWIDYGTRLITNVNSGTTNWTIQPFRIWDIGRSWKYRFISKNLTGTEMISEIDASTAVPFMWHLIQGPIIGGLILLVLIASPITIVYYRRYRRRGLQYQDVLILPTWNTDTKNLEISFNIQKKRMKKRIVLSTSKEEITLTQNEIQRILNREISGPSLCYAQSLFKSSFFNDEINEIIYKSSNRLRLRLDLSQSPSLATLPWELILLDMTSKAYIADSISLLRFIPTPNYSLLEPKIVSPPIKMLVIVSSPKGLEALDYNGEKNRIESSLHEFLIREKIDLHFTEDATLESLGKKLGEGFDVVHFIGHGKSIEDKAYLMLKDEYGDQQPVDHERLRGLLFRGDTKARYPILLFLNTCYSVLDNSFLPNIGNGLIQPIQRMALVGMQHAIYDESAIAFSGQFYASLLNYGRVDYAVAMGRKQVLSELGGNSEIRAYESLSPVIYTNANDGQIFQWE